MLRYEQTNIYIHTHYITTTYYADSPAFGNFSIRTNTRIVSDFAIGGHMVAISPSGAEFSCAAKRLCLYV